MTIPCVFHRAWLGGEEPEWTRPFADSWTENHPGWELSEWDDGNVEDLFPLVNQDIFDRADEIAPDHVGQLRSDVLRYEILHRFGGVWVDTDLQCLRPIGDLVGRSECFAAWERQHRWIGNTILGCVPGHPAMAALVDGLARNVRRRAGARPNKLSGPQYLSRAWRPRSDVAVLNERLFYPFGWDQADQFAPGDGDAAERWPEARSVHWWANQRRKRALL